MNEIKVADYLEDFNKIINRGKCKSCSTMVSWTRERVASHKRSNCTSISAEERSYFAKRRLAEVSTNDKSNDSTQPAEKQIQSSKEEIDAAIGNFFYRSGIPFSIADSAAWKSLISCVNPSYAQQVPTAKSLSNQLLDKQYNEARGGIDDILSESKNLTLTCDGWTNIEGDGLVHFMIKAPGRQSFLYKSINTSGIVYTSVTIANEICYMMQNVGEDKIDAVVTDNTPVMQAAWKIINERCPWVSAYGCAVQGLNLLIKDIVEIPENLQTVSDASKIIQFVTNHHLVCAMFEEKRKDAGVTTKLVTSVPQWHTEYTSAKSLIDAKVALKCLANDSSGKLQNIQPKPESTKAMSLIKSDKFWSRLESLVEDLEFPSEVIGECLI